MRAINPPLYAVSLLSPSLPFDWYWFVCPLPSVSFSNPIWTESSTVYIVSTFSFMEMISVRLVCQRRKIEMPSLKKYDN